MTDPKFAQFKQRLLDNGWETVKIEQCSPPSLYTQVTCERWSELAFKRFRVEEHLHTERLQYISVWGALAQSFNWRYATAVSAWVDEHWKAPPVWVTQAEIDTLRP